MLTKTRYHFEIRTPASFRASGAVHHPAGTFTPAFYADTLEDAEQQAVAKYPDAFRIILTAVDFPPTSSYPEPNVWESVEQYEERTGRTITRAAWRELVATTVARADGVAVIL